MKQLHWIGWLLGISLLWWGCRSPRSVQTPTTDHSVEQAYATYLQAHPLLSAYQSKVSLTLKMGDKSLSSRATLRMSNGRFVQLSLQPLLGIEAFRLLCTPHELLILDRLNRRFFRLTSEKIAQMGGGNLDPMLLFDLLSNRINHGQDSLPLFHAQISDGQIALRSKATNTFISSYLINSKDGTLIRTAILAPQGEQALLACDYSLFETYPNRQCIASQLDITLPPFTSPIALTMKMSDIQMDKDLQIDLSVPTGYQEISLSELLQMLKQ